MVRAKSVLEGRKRRTRIEHRRHCDHRCDIKPRVGLNCDAQHEVPAEREPDKMQGLTRQQALQAMNGPDHLRQTTGMEQLAIQMMGIAVVAQVEAHHVKSEIKKLLR